MPSGCLVFRGRGEMTGQKKWAAFMNIWLNVEGCVWAIHHSDEWHIIASADGCNSYLNAVVFVDIHHLKWCCSFATWLHSGQSLSIRSRGKSVILQPGLDILTTPLSLGMRKACPVCAPLKNYVMGNLTFQCEAVCRHLSVHFFSLSLSVNIPEHG